MAYYYTGRSGDSFTDATIHASDDCPDLSGPVRPITESSVDEDAADLCGSCNPLGHDSDSDTDSGNDDGTDTGETATAEPTGTCEVELSNSDEECGRDRPCVYHD